MPGDGATLRGLRIRTKLILMITVIIGFFVTAISVVYIEQQRSLLQRETRSKIRQMKEDLITRGRVTAQIVTLVVERLLVSWEADVMVTTVNNAVKGDPEARYAILQDARGMVLIHTADKNVFRQVLNSPSDRQALVATTLTVRDIGHGAAQILEVVSPISRKTILPDGTKSSRKWGVLRIGYTLEQIFQKQRAAQVLLKRRLDSLRLIAVVIMLGCLLVGVWAAVYVGRTISDPIERLSTAAHAISRGDLEREIVTAGNDEVGQLARDFETMRQSIQGLLVKTRVQARLESELLTVQAIQSALLPQSLPEIDGFQFSSFYESATETGGDWFGFLEECENEGLFILIGDVTGHGTPSALITATARSTCTTLRRVTTHHRSFAITPASILRYLNQEILSTGKRTFCMTFFAAYLDITTRRLRYANAGHNKPIVLRRGASGVFTDVLHGAGIRLGDQDEVAFEEHEAALLDGDVVLFYTDGLIEAENRKGHMFGKRRLVRHLKGCVDLDAAAIIDAIHDETTRFRDGEPLKDDISFVVMKVGDLQSQSRHDTSLTNNPQ